MTFCWLFFELCEIKEGVHEFKISDWDSYKIINTVLYLYWMELLFFEIRSYCIALPGLYTKAGLALTIMEFEIQ